MKVTVLLCVLSTLTFCLCARGVLAMAPQIQKPLLRSGGYSPRARRMARLYITISLVILATASLAGAVHSYIELFFSL